MILSETPEPTAEEMCSEQEARELYNAYCAVLASQGQIEHTPEGDRVFYLQRINHNGTRYALTIVSDPWECTHADGESPIQTLPERIVMRINLGGVVLSPVDASPVSRADYERHKQLAQSASYPLGTPEFRIDPLSLL